MAANYHKHVGPNVKVPVTEKLKANQVKNSAGGFVWRAGDWDRLNRFLILGSEGGSYYISERKLTKQNGDVVMRCLASDPERTVNTIVDISDAGRAPKNDPALFALALAAASEDVKSRTLAFAALTKVARTGTHLFTFVEYVDSMRGWGRGLRNAVAKWYTEKDADKLAYQVLKYGQRNGWSHRDLLRLSHARSKDASTNSVLAYAAGKSENPEMLPGIIQLMPSKDASAKIWAQAIRELNLPREVVPTEHLNNAAVWEALLERMPMTAMVRNLGKMSSLGLLSSNTSQWAKHVANELTNEEKIRKSRAHPISFLLAQKIYGSGHGRLGSLSWSVNGRVKDALDDAFVLAFGNVVPTGKRISMAIDVSGSMGGFTCVGADALTARDGAAAMALVTARVEKDCDVVAFSHKLVDFHIGKNDTLSSVIGRMERMPFGSTDASLPVKAAASTGTKYDAFLTYTDSETWMGGHPAQSLVAYRKQTGLQSKMVVVGMSSNGFTIADPSDPGMLDVVGFDTSAPNVISEFVR